MSKTTGDTYTLRPRYRFCEICDYSVPVHEWREHNKSEDHYANEKEALRNYEIKLSGDAVPTVNGSLEAKIFFCDRHEHCGAQPCCTCEQSRKILTTSYSPRPKQACELSQDTSMADCLPGLEELVWMMEQFNTTGGNKGRADTTWASCDCGIAVLRDALVASHHQCLPKAHKIAVIQKQLHWRHHFSQSKGSLPNHLKCTAPSANAGSRIGERTSTEVFTAGTIS
ncbi:uncharacterized protein CC84DRAFT_808177 [Paraphaeosphaeria sporulosa]|uniref:Uncharacterized protein n=1 Tax=Paraphaeosphaeria sporulosa TaxID=1460663 RepID=A0A177CDS4_9PLEO|nr:uncharacterized protein CC84DRAFT_808177 [Paraphaeosphaeria sporulosa]OAG04870.1 hypothetical protein CC84DRAFT_808177 [Paraphaeosphaeria sporulosa]